jgi:hypothetical protein
LARLSTVRFRVVVIAVVVAIVVCGDALSGSAAPAALPETAGVSASAASTNTGVGYSLVASDGGVFGFGGAGFFGSTGGMRLNRPIVGMASTPDGRGYWLVASDGGVFGFGDAGFFGSTGGMHLNEAIVGMASTPDGRGYWLVASDGGIFAFGDAKFYGSTGNLRLNQPIVGVASTPDGGGYWLVASDGGIFGFGDAGFFGSTGGMRLNRPIVGMASTPDGRGYWLVASDGGVFGFGDAGFFGSTGGMRLNRPIVGMAVVPAAPVGTDDGACPSSGYDLPGEEASLATAVDIPSLPPIVLPGEPPAFQETAADLPSAYTGNILRPADTGSFPGHRPMVVLFDGDNGNQCQLWWLARYLAGTGFVVLTVNSPAVSDPAHTEATYGVALDAGASAMEFATSPTLNPDAAVSELDDLGLAGWSQGSIVASELQGLPGLPPVKAVVALDNLRASLTGDPGAPANFCDQAVTSPVHPVAPALGFAMDATCTTAPTVSSPTLKQSGWSAWRSAGLPAVELVMAGYDHTDFSTPGPKLDPLGPDIGAWLDAWMDDDQGALTLFARCASSGGPAVGDLATDFDSAAYLPTLALDTTDLQSACPAG